MSVSLDHVENVAVITLDDGGKNVINHAVLDQLEQAWEDATTTAGAVVISGRPGSFCAGYDISVMTGDDPQAAVELGRRGGVLAYKLFGSDTPTVAVSTGHAFTIGAVWLACCDVRIGEQGAFRYGMTEVALNVGFGDWPLQPLQERLNPQLLVPSILHSRVYAPDEALQAGFIDHLVPAGKGMEMALSQAQQLATLPKKAYGVSKRALRKQALNTMAADLGL